MSAEETFKETKRTAEEIRTMMKETYGDPYEVMMILICDFMDDIGEGFESGMSMVEEDAREYYRNRDKAGWFF